MPFAFASVSSLADVAAVANSASATADAAFATGNAAQASASAASAAATSAAAAAAAADAKATAATAAAAAAAAAASALAAEGIIFMPAVVPENGPAVMTLARGVRVFTSYAKEPFTLIWDPKELYVGWTISGCVAGAGTVTFMAAPGTTVTLRDVSGAVIPMGQPAVFQGGFGHMVCTEKTESSLTIQTVLGSLGVQSLHVIPDIQTGSVISQAGSTNVMSYATSHVDYIFNPALYEPQGYERRFLQVGSGSLKLKGAEGTALIFLSTKGEVLSEIVLAQGESLKVLCIAQSAVAATLQIRQ